MTHTPNHSRYSLRSAAKLGLGLLSLLSLSAGTVAHAGTVNWDGTAADWFSAPSHWVGGTAPGSGDDAVNNSAAAMTLGQSTTIQSFFSNGAFTLNSATLSGSLANAAGTLTVNNVFNDNGGTISNFTINQGTGGSLVFGNNGGNNLINSIVNANVTLAGDGFLRVQNANTVNGTINLSTTSNGLNIYDGNATLTLGSGGGLAGFGNVFQSGGGATLTNNGTVNANASGQTLSIGTSSFNNAGTAEATNGGILSLTNALTSSGALNAVGAGSVVSLSGTLTNGAGNLMTASGGGQIQVNGATLLGTINEASDTALVFNNNGGNNFINTSINGNLDLATNADAFLRFQGVGTVNGTINLATTSNGLDIYDGNANLTLSNSGSLVGFGSVFQQGGGATLTNNGTVNAGSNGKTLAVGTTNFVNNGTAEATNGGVLSLSNTVSNNGTISAKTGGSVDITGTLTNNSGSQLNGAGGTVNVQGATLLGTINTNAGTTLVFDNNGGNNFVNISVSGGALDLATNANAFLRFQGVGTVNSQINLGTTSNGLDIYDGNANLTLATGNALAGFGSVFQQGGGATLTNNGTVDANTSGKTLSIGTTNFANNSLAEATNGGILSLNNAATNNGILAAKSGGVVDVTGTLTNNSGSSIDGAGGTVNIQGATLLGTITETVGTALTFDNNGGNNFVNTSITGGALDLATNSSAFLRFQGVGTVSSQISLGTTSNGLDIYDGNANLTLGSTGGLAGFGTVFQQGGGATLTNNGLVNANVSGQTLNINTTNFVNAGTTEVQNGAALNVTSAVTDSGNVLVKTGGTATFTQNLVQTGGLIQADGTLNSAVSLTGGALVGTGTVNGAVENNGGTVSAGNSSSPFGTLAVGGTFKQAPNGTLDVGFNSMLNNLLSVSGAVLTGGTLDVSYLGAGAYTGTGPFTFLNYGSLTSSITGTAQPQYFANETFLSDGTGVIAGHNGFTYALLNNTAIDGLQLEVLTNGAPAPAVPEASTTVSFGLLLALGGGLLVAKRRRTA